MRTYCVKDRDYTECVPGSEQYVTTRNNRLLLKCKCAECGITKLNLLKEQREKDLY